MKLLQLFVINGILRYVAVFNILATLAWGQESRFVEYDTVYVDKQMVLLNANSRGHLLRRIVDSNPCDPLYVTYINGKLQFAKDLVCYCPNQKLHIKSDVNMYPVGPAIWDDTTASIDSCAYVRYLNEDGDLVEEWYSKDGDCATVITPKWIGPDDAMVFKAFPVRAACPVCGDAAFEEINLATDNVLKYITVHICKRCGSLTRKENP